MSLYNNLVKVFRTRSGTKLPERAHPTDAGMDFFFSPSEPGSVTIIPGQSVLLETGIKMQVPANCMLQIMNKSGIASKKHLVTGACVVDEGYTGEIFVNLHNIGKEPETIISGQKIAQGVFVRIEKPFLLEVEEGESIYGTTTQRGSGALGSTGDS
jgi:dUTP pyrophosphatase